MLKKLSSDSNTEIIKNEVTGDRIHLKTENIDIEMRKEVFEPKEIYRGWHEEFNSQHFYTDYIANRITPEAAKINFYNIDLSGKNIEVGLDKVYVKGDNELNNFFMEFGLPAAQNKEIELSTPWKKPDHLKDIAGEVTSSIDAVTGDITTKYRTMVFNDDGYWHNFPEKFVSLEEMVDLMLPKECQSKSKVANSDLPVTDDARKNNKQVEVNKGNSNTSVKNSIEK